MNIERRDIMKNLTCDEKLSVINSKVKELLQLISEVEQGDEVDFNEITAQVLDIHRDELKLINIIRDYENRHDRVNTLDLSGLIMVKNRGA
jgi:hypothetical protein